MDVLLLADVFENFIKKCLEFYKINPLYCYSAPGFTFKAFLKFSTTRLDYIKDHELLLLLENNIRGGISQELWVIDISKVMIIKKYYT